MTSERNVIDCHVHLRDAETVGNLETVREHCGIDRMSIVCQFGWDEVNDNPPGFVAKASHPERYYVFAGLDHSQYFSSGQIGEIGLASQVDRLIALGADGVKLIETKPTCRKYMRLTADSDYFDGFFARIEETGLPLLWHVADPEEFWDPNLTPEWAKKRGWGYDETFVAKEALYSEVDHILARYPRLNVIFAHFFFLSEDLDRASALFEKYTGVHFDLAPGVEMLYNMSRDPERTREFFERHCRRILFGTDIFSTYLPEIARHRQGIVRRFLETDDEYHVPDGADFLLGPPEDGVFQGLALSDGVLDAIYRGNFERLAGKRPKTLDLGLAIEECDRIACEQAAFTNQDLAYTAAQLASAKLRARLLRP
ncbi:MAG: amidohydrolase [Armatimonadetes bacterium]|nr:amidohydrolase [Armatimonadota bacterium]